MSTSAIVLASAYAAVAAQAGATVAPRHYGHSGPPSPDSLTGSFSFTDWRGRPVGEGDFRGRWTLLYFGYSRCTDSCPQAIPAIVSAATMLRTRKIQAHAAFVDIEAPPLQMVRHRTGENAHQNHFGAAHLEQLRAMKAIARGFGDNLSVLTGTRGQLARAAAAFRVTREHTPPRAGENGHSLNHSSLVYFIAPSTRIAGYGYHDSAPADLARAVTALARKA